MNLATSSAAVAMTAVGALLNNGTLKFYTGTIPASPETAIVAQTLLATFTFAATAFGTPSYASPNETAAASFASTMTTPTSSGTVTWARGLRSDGVTVVADFTVGVSGSDLNLTSVGLLTTVNVTITSFALTLPAV